MGQNLRGLGHFVEKKTCAHLGTKYFHNCSESAKENTRKLLGRKSELNFVAEIRIAKPGNVKQFVSCTSHIQNQQQ